MMSAKLWAPALTACALATSIALVGCSKDPKEAQQAGAAQQMPPTEVGIIVAQPQSVEQSVELSGRTTAFEISEVRPQTSGVVLKRLFAEGSYVREGQALYEIDSSTNRANVDNARASIASAEANLGVLRVKEGRYRQLVGSNAISKQEYDDIVAQVKLAEATLNASRATLKNAEINLGYSTVRAPISGQTNRSTVTSGALVTMNQESPLVTIQRLDPIYVDINQSSAELLRLRQQLSKGSLDSSNNTKVKLTLEDGSEYSQEGRLAFSDASVNPDTGTVTLRAVFPNPNHLLLPGMFANAKIVQGVIPNAYLVPQIAITRTPTGQAIAMIVNAKGAVESRPVTTAGVHGKDWIITEGLTTGDKVIVDGIAKVKPEQQVVAKPYQPQAAAPQGAQGQAKPASEATAKPEQKATSNT
ncbi:efflux RND transporter periplasmic adaptor subunit [Acinetobacter sp. SwsAc6]|uniref:Efflux RND transporter periplasmic adaptor subunit n=1 Tax=Acinetobacter cumulans TaxID=2136182 RepID=A0A498CXD6_9GAMM|nr:MULTISPECIES: efflux RND transporter periplasmic adaptor subunit [Acinetobacter]NWK73840.1 efflux RND transporter periplasmic adaptor subunit [Acinetobacter sp. SwsAc6]QCO23008.1 efflux RND transporter periplasmic adaptor subunit [Acinetobacter cumulans]QFU78779.1 efflux RND transporter periplasmic adaptor subunit [Acinetobacter cumulans]RKG48172.1 efflux RND transporter periplasmic adaptor subunit [Acinetobacter cumulans]RLL35521.1 efflux RND transporter periplasmic adaptor subunit [Acinet